METRKLHKITNLSQKALQLLPLLQVQKIVKTANAS